ncbi:ABC transporter permease [Clostridium thermarum]|uniref:ABC transporter permease n=1 Tax=Clostridium thermarum TaxID=1716543 RepID=UPI0013D30EDC|nr:ABC transporter permease [Clostridium thermarum]
MFTESIARFFLQSWLSFKALFGWIDLKVYFLVKIITPIFQMIFFCLLAKFSYNTNDLTPWVIGNSFLLCVYNCIFGIGDIFVVERYYGTLKVIIASSANKFITFFQRGVVHMVDSLLTVTIGLTIGAIIFNVSFNNVNLLVFFIITITGMFSAIGFGLFLGSFGLILSNMNLLMNIFSMMLMALSGANFPLEWFPSIIQKISNCFPITRSIKAANMLISNNNFKTIYGLIGQEILLGFIYIILGYLFIQVTEYTAKKRASFEIY